MKYFETQVDWFPNESRQEALDLLAKEGFKLLYNAELGLLNNSGPVGVFFFNGALVFLTFGKISLIASTEEAIEKTLSVLKCPRRATIEAFEKAE